MSPFKFSIVLLLMLLLSACSEKSTDDSPIDTGTPSEEIREEVPETEDSAEEKIDLKRFFMKDGSVAKYLGDGNEYASYQARTQWHNDNTVSIYEDNGGTVVIRTYRITEDSIHLIKEQAEYYETYSPTDEELKSLPIISTILQTPIETGKTFDEWTVVSIDQTLETPYKTFDDVIVLEKTDESGALQRKYFVQDFGEIKREFIMKENDAEFSVTSTLESVD